MTDYTAEEVVDVADRMRKYMDVPYYYAIGKHTLETGLLDPREVSDTYAASELIGLGVATVVEKGYGPTLDWRGVPESRTYVITDCDDIEHTGKTPLAAMVAAVEAVLPLREQAK
ncbi:MAG: hypothetical protein ACE5FH_13270 [Candidatus Zixiibacteriota bacterium]